MELRHPSTRLTIADLEHLPDDGLRHEIIHEDHYVTASPVTRHQRISGRLLVAVQSHLDAHPSPDLIYVSHSRAHLLTTKNLQGAPDLVIEILSPSTRPRDEHLKRDLYERVGVEEYWLVDPDHNVVTMYRREGWRFLPPETFEANAVVSTPLLPGFELPPIAF